MSSTSAMPASDWLKYESFGVFIYFAIGVLALETASLHQATAAVWFASGFAIAWLGHRGISRWPTIAAGALILNSTTFVAGDESISIMDALPAALMIAAGNTCEAILGAYALRRWVGPDPFARPGVMVRFIVFVGICPALVSALTGVLSIKVFDRESAPGLDIFTTWYFANATGAIIMTPIVLWLMKTRSLPEPVPRPFELLATTAFLLIVLQPLLGSAFFSALDGWPNAYMVLPILMWFCYRFGVQELFLALFLTVTLSVIGTLRGHAAFPAPTSWQSLSYLQVFLAVTTSVCFMLKASQIEGAGYRRELEGIARMRRHRVDSLLAERDELNQLVVHDLQSPLAGMRGALETARVMAPSRPEDFAAIKQILDLAVATCDEMLTRARGLLRTIGKEELAAPDSMTARDIINRILSSQQIEIDRKDIRVRLSGSAFANVIRDHGLTAFLAMEVVIENAIRMSPHGGTVCITATTVDDQVHYEITDEGPGVSPGLRSKLFEQAVTSADGSSGIGLLLAHRALGKAGGGISVSETGQHGAAFSISIRKEK
jgi:integral membrane sensor domain MASE1